MPRVTASIDAFLKAATAQAGMEAGITDGESFCTTIGAVSESSVDQTYIEGKITAPESFRTVLGADIGAPVSDTVLAILEAHAAANSGCAPWALTRWAWALTELEDGGILDELKEGMCFRSGFNTAGSIKTIGNSSVTTTGTVPLTPDGALFTASASNYLLLTVTDSRVFAAVADFRYAPDAPSLSAICSTTAVGGTNTAGVILLNVGPNGSVFTASGGSAANSDAFGNLESAFSVNQYNPNDTIAGWSSDNAATPTVKGWVNGVPILNDSTGTIQAGSATTVLTIGAALTAAANYAYPMAGTIASFFLFSRVLSDAEQLVAAKAARHLDPRLINIVTYGDSRTTQLNDAAKITGNWPYQYATSAAIARKARLCNIANNGWPASTMASNFTARGGHLGPNGKSVLESHFIFWTGANDWQAGVTGANCWTTVTGILRAARALGMRVTCCTDPEGGTTYDPPEEAERVAYNSLVLAGYREWDAVWDLDTIIGTAHDAGLWLDQVHLNNNGNKTLASNLAAGGFARPEQFT